MSTYRYVCSICMKYFESHTRMHTVSSPVVVVVVIDLDIV